MGTLPPDTMQEFFDQLPREIRHLVVGHMVYLAIDHGKLHEFWLPESLARTLNTANEQTVAAIENGQRHWFRHNLRVADWIREAMDNYHDEGSFRGVLIPYEGFLAQQSIAAVEREIEELPYSMVKAMNERIPDLMETHPPMPSPAGELYAIGDFLARGLHRLYMAAVAYGVDRGLFIPEAVGAGHQDLGEFPMRGTGRRGDFILVDTDHMENIRMLEDLVENVRRDWGAIHPLVQGFVHSLREAGWADAEGRHRLRPAVEEVELYLRDPH